MITRTIGLILIGAFLVSCSSTSGGGKRQKTVRISPRSSEAKIRNVVLEHTPLGSSSDFVLTFTQTQLRHKGTPKVEGRGARKRSLRPLNSGVPGSRNIDEWIGSQSISDLEVGWHWETVPMWPLITYVYLSWAFDENSRLIDVIVYKETDGP